MTDRDDFEAIIGNQPEMPEDSEGELEHIWDALEHMWPHFYEGLLVKGVLLVEYIDPDDGGRVLRFISSPNMSPWDTLGMLESARMDARDMSRSSTFRLDDDDDDEDDD